MLAPEARIGRGRAMADTRDTTPDIIAIKREMRDRQKARRAVALEAIGARINDDLVRHGTTLLSDRPAGVVSAYYPMAGEIWPLRLMAALKAKGHSLALPVMQGKTDPLVFRAWAPGDELIAGVWGIRQPAPSQPAVLPDILLVPLLAFDRSRLPARLRWRLLRPHASRSPPAQADPGDRARPRRVGGRRCAASRL